MARQMRSGGGGEGRTANPGDSIAGRRKPGQHVLWVLDPQGKPRPVPVQIGISDGSSTEISSDTLKEGDQVITGQQGVEVSTNNQQVNPFAPRFGPGRR
jgi:multidrug efflux pump subunit AcrA (membrane-fusion protein)